MFGKKQTGSMPPPKTPSEEKKEEVQNKVEPAQKDVIEEKEAAVSSPASDLAVEVVEPKAPAKKEDQPKKKKSAADLGDPFAEGLEEADALAEKKEKSKEKTGQDSIAEVRLQRARNRIWLDLRDGIDLKALARMEAAAARDEVNSAVEEIARFRNLDLTPAELQSIAKECSNDMLGFGPLEELLERDDIADIMINGPDTTYIEVDGKIEEATINFRDNQHLTTICQRIVGAIGRRVDEASPICDARLPDGSRVNVIIPPLAVDGACMTIRKFKKDKLTLDKLMEFGSMSASCAKLIMAVGRCRVNVLVSGGTGSGKTTMLNCLTRYIEPGERVITCEDACELQLQQPHVVRLETRPPNLEGVGEITMRDLVKNCLRMRPERIIVGEVRGPEAFDLLQAMNTGHDGSMGTVHANNPREALSRMENMIAMGGLSLPQKAVREQIAGAVQVIIQVQRLRDGSRKTTHVTEITGMEGEVVTMQDLFVLDILGEDDDGKLVTKQRSTGLRPKFFDNARQFGVDQLVLDAMEEAFD
ncbi:CpaF family protein [Alphaproteobacteria bacterium]|nr:CpaF family protein [Alphaproteobacteria bacterium]